MTSSEPKAMEQVVEAQLETLPAGTKRRKKKLPGGEGAGPEVGSPEAEDRGSGLEPALLAPPPEEPDLCSPSKKRKRETQQVQLPEGAGNDALPQVKEQQEEPVPLTPKKRKKKEKRQNVTLEPDPEAVQSETGFPELGGDMMEPASPGAAGPCMDAALMSTKKKKKKKWLGPGAADLGTPGPAEPLSALVTPKKAEQSQQEATELGTEPGLEGSASKKKKKKKKQGEESGALGPEHPEETSEPVMPPTHAPKRKRKLEPV